MLQALVFDFDGVIVDSEPLHYRAFAQVAQEACGLRFSYADYLERYIGFDDRDAFAQMLRDSGRGEGTDGQRIAALCQAKGDAFEALVRQGLAPYPGVTALLDDCAAAGVPTAIASGATRRDIDLILGGLGLHGRFAAIVTADQVERSKPHPETYALAVEALAALRPELNLSPGGCLAIEDTAAGIQSARGAGLLALGVTTTSPAAALAQAHRVVERLEGLSLARLRQWFD